MVNTLDILKRIFSEVLLSSEQALDLNKPYVEMGVDSILAIQIAKLIKLKLDYAIQPSELYNFTSIEHLSEHLDQRKKIIKDVAEHMPQVMEHTLSSDSNKTIDPIVIVGISGKFPGSMNIWEYGDHLCQAKCFISDSNKRWQTDISHSWKAGFLEDIDKFDADFFNISPREALMMDPQQRIMLEKAVHAFEDAGLTLDMLNNSNTAIITTALPGDYKMLLQAHKDLYSSYSFIGNAFSTLSGRISHFFNLKGLSLSIDTACSSSLVAIDIAYNYLKSQLCDFALVGAASLFSTPELFRLAQASNLLSKSSKCSTFDKSADGFIPAESVCCIVLTTLSKAQKYQQQIYAIVEGIGVSHDGFTNGIMSPNSYSQKELIVSTYKRHHIDTAKIGYVEAHGTGTPLGDPLETQALKDAFETFNLEYKCTLGSSKPNVGHALVASGALSIAKAIYMFKYNRILPQINFETLNPQIKLGNFNINTTIEDWPKEKNLIAINALGFSGTNAHLVLRKYHTINKNITSSQNSFIYVFSSKNIQSLRNRLQSFLEFIERLPETELGNLSYSLNCKTSIFQYRFITYSNNKELLLENITKFLNNSTAHPIKNSQKEQEDYQKFIEAYKQSKTDSLLKFCDKIGGFFTIDSNLLALEHLYTTKYQKISLPEYPFNRQSFWVLENNYTNIVVQSFPTVKEQDKEEELLIPSKIRNDLKHTLKHRLAELLDYAPEMIKDDIPLIEYGIDSLIALQLLNPFSSEIVSLTPNIVFDCKTINKLTEKLYELKRQNSLNIHNEYENYLRLPERLSHIPVKQKLLKENDIEIEWFIFGEAANKPLLLLPPLNTLAHVWIQQILYFTNNSYTIFIPHYPGHGAARFYPVTLLELASTILNQVYRLNDEEKINIVGWSLGGCLSLSMLDILPSNINKVILVNTAAKFENDIFAQSIKLREELELKSSYLRSLYQRDMNPCINYIGANANLDALKHYYDSLQLFNAEEKLKTTTNRCMAFLGLKDPVITVKDKELLQSIPNIKIIEYEHAGHFIPLTNPLEFNRTTFAFIKGDA
jgi:3-oxoacyl-(acyl-carrier-protein) synthase/pimeloyl-ACP methyl ester carboxylesterase/acyl carrier protein